MRAILDYAGGHDVKVVPCKEDMLFERMGVVIRLPEPDWASARPEGWTRGGSWGSQRTILFSGMKCARPLHPTSLPAAKPRPRRAHLPGQRTPGLHGLTR